MADRGGRRQAQDIVPYGRAERLFEDQLAWQNDGLIQDDLPPENEDDDLDNSGVYSYLQANNGWERFTNFNRESVLDIWRPLDSRMNQERRRGPMPLTSTVDHLLLYLTWLKSGQPYAQIATVFRISETRLEDALNRVRGPLLEVLEHRWWQPRSRPRYRPNSVAPTAVIIIDGHTTEICQPKMPYEQAKHFFDGKNRIYGYKNEVAVSAAPPHFCLFVSPHFPGSVHDYEIHKQVYRSYGQFLLMSPQEVTTARLNPGEHYWTIMGDKGYIGPPDDTEPLKRVCPRRGGGLTPIEVASNRRINEERVVIEQFFGRNAILWHTFTQSWKYDESHFDTDLSIAFLLTNEHIRLTALDAEDQDGHLKRVAQWWKQYNKKKRTNSECSQKYKAKRAQRMRETYGLEAVERM